MFSCGSNLFDLSAGSLIAQEYGQRLRPTGDQKEALLLASDIKGVPAVLGAG